MITLDRFDYGIYLEGKHIADIDDLDYAKFFANATAINTKTDTMVVDNYTGEIITQFVVKQHIEVVEVEP